MSDVTVADVERAVARAFPPEWAEEWDRVLAVNLGGIVNGLRAFVPPANRGPSVSTTYVKGFARAPLTYTA